MNSPLDIPTCRVLIIFVPDSCVGRNEWQSKRHAWVAEARQRGSSGGCETGQAGKEAGQVREPSRENVEDAESNEEVAKVHVRIMCVSCESYVCMCVRIMCVLVVWARLTSVHRAHACMLIHTVFTNTTCEGKKPQLSAPT